MDRAPRQEPLEPQRQWQPWVTGTGIVVLLCLVLPATAQAAEPSGAITGMLTKFFGYADAASKNLSAQFISKEALYILTACVVWRILMVVIPAMLEGDLTSFASDALQIVIIVFIITTLFANWNGGVVNIRRDTGEAMLEINQLAVDANAQMPGPEGGGGKQVQCTTGISGSGNGHITTSAIASVVTMAAGAFNCVTGNLMGAIESVAHAQFGNYKKEGFFAKVGNAMASLGMKVLVITVMLIALLVLVLVFITITIEAMLAWVNIIVPLTFGPIVIAFYPVNKRWTSNVINELAGGLIAYAASIFILLIVATVFIDAANSVITFIHATGTGGLTYTGFSKSILFKVVALAMVGMLMAYAGKGFTSAAVRLVDGTDHFSHNRGGMAAAAGGAIGGAAGAVGGSAAMGLAGKTVGMAAQAPDKIAGGIARGVSAPFRAKAAGAKAAAKVVQNVIAPPNKS